MGALILIYSLCVTAARASVPAHCAPELGPALEGSLITLESEHDAGGRSGFSGVLRRAGGTTLDFGSFLLPRERIVPASVRVPVAGELIIATVAYADGIPISQVGIYQGIDGALIRLSDHSVPLANVIGPLVIVSPGDNVYVEYFTSHDSPGEPEVLDISKRSYVTTYLGHQGSQLVFDALTVAAGTIHRLHRR